MVLVIALPLAVAACIAGSAASLVVRYRRSQGRERLQLRRAVAAGAATAATFGATMVSSLLFGGEVSGSAPPAWVAVLQALTLPAFALIPAAIVVAIRRYRLYEIDRIVSRTVAHAIVVALLAGAYVAATGLSALVLPADSDLAVAASTLVVAGAFRPLRRRVRARVDRRFDRARYHADLEVAAFSRRLRHEVDLDAVAGEIAAVIARTLAPSDATLWIAQQRGR